MSILKINYKILIYSLIIVFVSSCEKKEDNNLPKTIEERTITSYLKSFSNASEPYTIKIYSMQIVDLTVSDMRILNHEEHFNYYENANTKREQVTIKDSTQKYIKRNQKDVIAKKVKCKFFWSNNPERIIEQDFILNKTGSKCIYTNDYQVVNGK